MGVLGVLTLELVLHDAHSLKEKRHTVRALKDRLRKRFNVSVAEIDRQDSWQHGVVAVAAVASDRTHLESILARAEDEAAEILGGALADSRVELL